MIRRIIILAVGGAFALLVMQVPAFVQQYTQRLGGWHTAYALELDKLPRSQGGQVAVSRALAEVLNEAGVLAKGLEDEFVSTEHLLLALSKRAGAPVGDILTRRGLVPDKIEAANRLLWILVLK